MQIMAFVKLITKKINLGEKHYLYTYYSTDIKVSSCDLYECNNNQSYCYIKNLTAYCE